MRLTLIFSAMLVTGALIAQTQQPATPGLTTVRTVIDPATGKPIPGLPPKPVEGPSVRVSGTVRESETGLPIGGARVLLQRGRNSMRPDQVVAGQAGTMSAVTTPDGTFSFDDVPPGPCSLNATAEGYIPGPDLPKWLSVRKPQTVEIQLIKPAAISGRIVDLETKKPVSGIRILASKARYQLGQLTLDPGFAEDVISDKDGAFRIEKLIPGPYFLEMVAPEAEEQIRTGDDAVGVPADDSPKLGYRRQWWPGDSAAFSQPFVARGGSTPNFADVSISKKPLFNMTGEVKTAGCAASRMVKIDVSQQYGQSVTGRGQTVTLPCGAKFAIANLSPGEYYITTGDAREGRLPNALAKVVIADRNLKQDLYLAPPLDVKGAVELPDGFPKSHPRLFFSAALIESPSIGGTGGPVIDDNTFELVRPYPETLQFQISGLPTPYYVSEIQYAGQPVHDGIVTLNPLSAAQTLTVRVSAKSATVQGTVKANGDPVASAKVILVPWPLRWKGPFPIYFDTSATDGSFTIAQLPPETYHVLSVEPAAWDTELQKPGVLAALAAEGTEVTASEGQTANPALELKRVVIAPW